MTGRRNAASPLLPALLGLCLLATAVAGCSFRAVSHVNGVVTALSASGPMTTGVPLTVTAQAAYRGDFKDPTLSVAVGTDAPQTIRVRAVAGWAEPFLGFGVFMMPRAIVRSVEIRASLTVERPGHYVIESVPADGSAAVRTAIDIVGG
jgi:hypothetical protein